MRTLLLAALTSALLAATATVASAAALIAVDAGQLAGLGSVPGLEPTGHGTADGVTAVAQDGALALLRERGVGVRVLVADLAAQDVQDRAADRAHAARQATSGLPSGRTTYRRLADYEADLDRLVARAPRLVRPITLALPTLQGRPIRGVEITHDVAARDGKPVFLQLGLHHAREWPSGEHALEFAFDLVNQDGKDARITALLDRVRVIVVPVVNPDGFQVSRESPVDPQDAATSAVAGLVQNGTAYRRKNCRVQGTTGFDPTATPCDLALGVDLNRNYGIHWGGNGASSFDEAPDFRGSAPFSEPESESVRRLVASRAVTMLITNHTSGNLVLRPPGVKSVNEVPDEAALKVLGERFAAQNGYVNQRSWELYDNSGTTEDYTYGVTGGFGYTFEINPENFHPAYERAVVGEYLGTGEHAGKGNREAYLVAMEQAADPDTHAVLEGFAPPGRVLRVQRRVSARTSPVCVTQPTGFFSTPCGPTTAPLPFTDDLGATRTVGPDGSVDWHLNPSSSPLAQDDGVWRLTCADAAGTVLEQRDVRLTRGQRLRVRLPCGQPRCRAPRALAERITVAPVATGTALRVRAPLRSTGAARGARVRLRIVRVASRSTTTPARTVLAVARLPRAGTRLAASGLRAGAYVVELSAPARAGGRDVRRRAVLVGADGRVRVGPRFTRADGCRELRVARLASPVFGGAGDTAPAVLVRLPAEATVTVRVSRAGRTVATLPARRVAGGRTVRLAIPRAARLPRGAYAVSVTSTRGTTGARATGRVTLPAQAL